jgi:branched-chain amino acid transport system permease protein
VRYSRARTDTLRYIRFMEKPRQWIGMGIFVGLLLLLPFLLRWIGAFGWIIFGNFTLITIIAVLGQNVITGMSGQISLGHSAFVMLGGYGVAIFTVQLSWPFWPALLVSAAVTGLLGALVAVPAMRLKGFYVAVVTLAFFFLAQYFFKRASFAGGFDGLVGIRSPQIFGLKIRRDVQWYYLLFALTALSVVGSANIARSRFGRSFFAVRDNAVAAASLGIHVGLAKMRAFFIGSLFAGLAGGLWASYVSVIRLDQFTLWDSIWYVGMIIIGGAGSTGGAVAGVIFLRLISQVLRTVNTGGWLPLNSNTTAALTYAVYGIVIILFVIFQPYGLTAVWAKIKVRIKSWPFEP